jgi:hypothetical protein
VQLLDNARKSAGDLDGGFVTLYFAEFVPFFNSSFGLDEPLDDLTFSYAYTSSACLMKCTKLNLPSPISASRNGLIACALTDEWKFRVAEKRLFKGRLL